MNKGLLILISAPSGAGKTSLVNEIINRDDQLIKSVSHTTRAKRPGEEESTDDEQRRALDQPIGADDVRHRDGEKGENIFGGTLVVPQLTGRFS